ncbi:MAG: hypothetical protein GX663_05975 [Clostridiales bacterium]|nr:hypothetical protein [Clostridiales bacterium]
MCTSVTLSMLATTIMIKAASGSHWFGETEMYGEEDPLTGASITARVSAVHVYADVP